MFWKFNILTSKIDTVLDKEDVTLREIMDEDDVLQECKGQNRKLIDFLTEPQHIEELGRLATEDPPDDVEEQWRYKYCNIACELLTSDVNAITDKMVSDDKFVNRFYAFLDSDRPSNPLMASFVSKIMGLLIARKSEQMLQYLQSKPEFVSLLMRHLGTSAIMDLLLRLITCIDNTVCRTQCIRWLDEQKLIQKLVALIDNNESEAKHCNASQCLCDVIRISREQMSQMQDQAEDDPLLATLESAEVVGQLLDHMFAGEELKESVLVNGMVVLQTLLEFRKLNIEGLQEQMTELDTQRLARGVHTTIQALIPRLADFHRILLNPPKQHFSCMPTTVGTMQPPLGNTRLQVVRLLTTLLSTNRPAINTELRRLGTLNVLLDLNFRYEWNNFLHQLVEQSIASILTSPLLSESPEQQLPLVDQLFRELRLVERVMQVWEDNEQCQLLTGGHRKGYMGHLTKIVNHIEECRHRENDTLNIKDLWQGLPEDVVKRWDEFVAGSLAELNKQNSSALLTTGRGHGALSSSEDDDADFRDVPFPQDTAMQLLGFKEDEFSEQATRVDIMFSDKISSINFDMSSDNASASNMFEQKCQRMGQFGDFDADDDMWEEKELSFSRDIDVRQKFAPQTSMTERDDSDDSDEDLDSPQQIFQQSKPAAKPADDDFADFVSASSPTVTAMDATFGPAPTSSTVANSGAGGSEGWASFDDMNKVKDGGQGQEGWADFTSFDKMSGDAGVSAPLSMETDSAARPTSYLADSGTGHQAMDVSESGSTSALTEGQGQGTAPPGGDTSSSFTDNRFISYTEVLKMENAQSGQGHSQQPCELDTTPQSASSSTEKATVSDAAAADNGSH